MNYSTRIWDMVDVDYEQVRSIVEPHMEGISDTIKLDDLIKDIQKTTTEKMIINNLYYYIADYCASKMSYHPDYNKLASRIAVKRLHKSTPDDYKAVVRLLYNNHDKSGKQSPLISDNLYRIVLENADKINEVIDMDRDYLFDYFGIRTLERSYLYRMYNPNMKNYYETDKKGQIIERPQHMWMRVAIGIHGQDLQAAFETYELISKKYFTHATPTLFNAASLKPQLSSCFLLSVDDNIDDLGDRIKHIMKISKFAGGIGIDLTGIRAKGSIIRGTNGMSDGIVPFCITLDKIGRWINQGGKRNGSIAVYLQPWHADVYDICELRKNTKNEDTKARDLFVALFIPDLFMKRVMNNEIWSLMCPDECPGLVTSYGDEFENLYLRYELEKKYKKQVRAVELFYHIMDSQIETGMPYILYKDHINRKSNQMNIGTIRSSNLCAEIVEYTDTEQIAVCNLASIALPRFIENNVFNFKKLIEVARVITRNLNKVIDINYYPVEQTKYSNMKHRPIGIGVQGLADVYNILKLPFGSTQSNKLNKQIFETIYYGALLESCSLAQKDGSYQTFKGSPFSQGKLQFDLWNVQPDPELGYDWTTLKSDIVKYGTRNSLITAVMPTATTSQILGYSESIEPYMSNIFVRSTLAGEFIVVNKRLIRELIRLGIWSDDMRKQIIISNGSIQNISNIPQELKDIYKTSFEIKQKHIITQATERGPFVDQTQSMNLFMSTPSYKILQSCHITSWLNGLKTGMYYLRSKPAVDPIKFGIDIDDIERLKKESGNVDNPACKWKPGMSREELATCDVCSA